MAEKQCKEGAKPSRAGQDGEGEVEKEKKVEKTKVNRNRKKSEGVKAEVAGMRNFLERGKVISYEIGLGSGKELSRTPIKKGW